MIQRPPRSCTSRASLRRSARQVGRGADPGDAPALDGDRRRPRSHHSGTARRAHRREAAVDPEIVPHVVLPLPAGLRACPGRVLTPMVRRASRNSCFMSDTPSSPRNALAARRLGRERADRDRPPTATIAARRRPGSARWQRRRAAGPVLPGMPNLHSHAFQRAMAGLTERRGTAGPERRRQLLDLARGDVRLRRPPRARRRSRRSPRSSMSRC